MKSSQLNIDDVGIFSLMARALAFPTWKDEVFPQAESNRGTEPRRSLLDRLDRWLWEREQQAVEAYLAQSTDIHDLEIRIRKLERGTPSLGG